MAKYCVRCTIGKPTHFLVNRDEVCKECYDEVAIEFGMKALGGSIEQGAWSR